MWRLFPETGIQTPRSWRIFRKMGCFASTFPLIQFTGKDYTSKKMMHFCNYLQICVIFFSFLCFRVNIANDELTQIRLILLICVKNVASILGIGHPGATKLAHYII
jgi:hypothetical protein